jgi:hypothetical protein
LCGIVLGYLFSWRVDLVLQIAQADLANASGELDGARARINSLVKELDETKASYALAMLDHRTLLHFF